MTREPLDIALLIHTTPSSVQRLDVHLAPDESIDHVVQACSGEDVAPVPVYLEHVVSSLLISLVEVVTAPVYTTHGHHVASHTPPVDAFTLDFCTITSSNIPGLFDALVQVEQDLAKRLVEYFAREPTKDQLADAQSQQKQWYRELVSRVATAYREAQGREKRRYGKRIMEDVLRKHGPIVPLDEQLAQLEEAVVRRLEQETRAAQRQEEQWKEEQQATQRNAFSHVNMAKVKELCDMGFEQDQAKAALELAHDDAAQAVNLLIESPERVTQHLTQRVRPPRRPSLSTMAPQDRPNSSTGMPARPEHGSPAQRQATAPVLPRSRTSTNPNPANGSPNRAWSALSFLKEQQMAMENTSASSSVRKLGGWLGKAIENLAVDEGTARQQARQPLVPTLTESFTITLGSAHTKRTNNLRLVTMDTALELFDPPSLPQDRAREIACRSQIASTFYGNALSGAIVLASLSQLNDSRHYFDGQGDNAALFHRCTTTTDFHCDSLSQQLQAIANELGDKKLQEGDFFITRHANLPTTHAVFHLVIDDHAIPSRELSSRHPIIIGLRNILTCAAKCDITSLSIPLLFVPDDLYLQPTANVSDTWYVRRGDQVLRAVKGFLIEFSRNGREDTKRQDELLTKMVTYEFLLPKDLAFWNTLDPARHRSHQTMEHVFARFRQLIVDVFRAT